MTITVTLSPEVERWVTRQLESGQFSSAADFVNARLLQDWLEEKVEEAFLEPATPLTSQDWLEARKRLEETLPKPK